MLTKSNEIKGIIGKVTQVVIFELELEDVTVETFNPDMDLIDDLGIDTIALVLQDEYKIEIDEDDYPKLKTIRLIAEYVEGRISARI